MNDIGPPFSSRGSYASAADDFHVVSGGQPTPFCFCPLSRVTRNCGTRRDQQLRLWRTKQIKPLPRRTCFTRSDDQQGKNAFREFCCKKKKWRWLATQDHAKLSTLFLQFCSLPQVSHSLKTVPHYSYSHANVHAVSTLVSK